MASRSQELKKTAGKQARDANFWKVLNAALELDFKKGHLKWTMSELSRKSGITRSLIYYHFGRAKIAILDQAIQVIGEEIIGISPERMQLWKSGDWMGSIKRTREVTSQSPHLANFYLLHRDRPTDAGATIRKIELSYLKKLQTLYPHLPRADHYALYTVFFGVTFSPFVDDEVIDTIAIAVKRLVGNTEAKL